MARQAQRRTVQGRSRAESAPRPSSNSSAAGRWAYSTVHEHTDWKTWVQQEGMQSQHSHSWSGEMRAERGRRPRCVTASLSRELDVMVVAGAENPGNAGEEKDAVAIPGSCQEWLPGMANIAGLVDVRGVQNAL